MNMKLITTLSLVALVSACGGGGGGHSKTSAEIFVDNINYDDPVESYYLAKDPTKAPGTIIVEEGNGKYFGVDIKDPTRFDDYAYDLDYYLDYSFQVFYQGNGYYEDVYGNLYEKTTEVSKDLEKVGALLTKARAKNIGEQLSANYGLSEARGIELGQMLVEYKDLKKTRALTQADDDRFSQMAFGSKVGEMAKAYDKYSTGDNTDMDALIQTAAQTNGTTPEHVRDLFQDVLSK